MIDNTEAYQQEKNLFQEALALPPAEREQFVRRSMPSELLAGRVLDMLARYAEQGPTEDQAQPAGGEHHHRVDPEALPVIENYRIIRKIGEGGFGDVYLAEQTSPLRREVAIKVIKPGMDSRAIINRFEQERQALAHINHPHVAQVFGAGTTNDGRPYFSMEFIDGVEITTYCDAHRLDLTARIRLFQQVCQAVQHAHQKGVIHRDIKPSNVLVMEENGKPQVKVIDFGIAKAIEEQLTERTLRTSQGMLIGTPEYMSPEQAGGDGDIDTRSDIYSLGVLLYEVLSGAQPFDPHALRAAGLAEIQRIIREVHPPKPSTRLSSLKSLSPADGDDLPPSPPGRGAGGERSPSSLLAIAAARSTELKPLLRSLRGDLDWIVMKCLEKERERRYETASELESELDRFLNNEPVEAGPPSRVYRVRKFAKRNRGAVVAASLIIGAILAGLVGTTWGLIHAEDQRRLAVKAQEAEKDRAEEAVAARAQMEVERTIAQQVNRLFTHDLLVAVANEGAADEITMRAIFEAAEERLKQNLFPDEPLAQAATHAALGVGFRVLSDFKRAVEHLESSLALRRGFAEQPDPHTAATLEELSVLYGRLGEYGIAEQYSREALALRIKIYGHDNLAVAESLNNIGRACQQQNKLSEAEDYLSRSLTLHKQLLPDAHPRVLMMMNNLGSLYSATGDYQAAADLYEQCLAAQRHALGSFHPDTVTTANNVGLFYLNSGDYKNAESLLLEAVAGDVRNFGDDHDWTLISKNNLAVLYKTTERFDLAEEVYVDVLARSRSKLGDDHPDTWTSMSNLSVLYLAQERYNEARSLIQEAIKHCTKQNTSDHPKTLLYMNNLASIERAEGNTTDAAEILSNVVDTAKHVLPEMHLKVADYLTNYGGTLRELGDNQGCEDALVEAEAIYATQVNPGHIALLEVRTGLVSLYDAWNKPIKAAQWRAKLPTDHAEYTPLPEGVEPLPDDSVSGGEPADVSGGRWN